MSGRVLVVEDQPLARRGLAGFLRGEGYFIEEAESGTAALRLIDSSTFDAVITDLHLGSGIDGFDVVTHFEESFPGKGKILVSGTGRNLQSRCDSMGTWFFRKPLKLDDLLDKLKSLLAKQTADAMLLSPADVHCEWTVTLLPSQRSEILDHLFRFNRETSRAAITHSRHLMNHSHRLIKNSKKLLRRVVGYPSALGSSSATKFLT